MRQPLLLLRADGGAGIGYGHVIRCVALGQAWEGRRGRAILASSSLPQELAALVEAAGMRHVDVYPTSRGLADLVRRLRPAWTVLDGYHFDVSYHRAGGQGGGRVAVIDDHGAVGSYDAEVIIDYNLNADEASYKRRRQDTILLLDHPFVLLRQEFLQLEPRSAEHTGVRHMIVTLGGSPPAEVSATIETAIDIAGVRSIATVLSKGGGPVHNMAELLSASDVALSAAGTSTWELCFLGVPMVLVPIADNQCPMAKAMATFGACIACEIGANAAEIATAVRRLVDNPSLRASLSARAQKLVDGRGSRRVVTVLKRSLLRLRPAALEDAQLLFLWLNDAMTRAASFHSEPVSWEQHVQWLTSRLQDPDSRVLIAEEDDGPVGQIRGQRDGHMATVGVLVAPDRRGEGWGPAIISLGSAHLTSDGWVDVLHAWVRSSNAASNRAFEEAGFELLRAQAIEGVPALHYTWSRDSARIPGDSRSIRSNR